VPLSEHEQQILAELEESLSKADPRFAKSVRETNVYSHSLRQVRWGAAGFLVGLIVLVAFFSQSILLGLAGVTLMFLSAVLIERNARRIGRASWRDLTRPRSGEDATSVAAGSRTTALREWLNRQRRRSQ